MSRDKIEINNHLAVKEILSPQGFNQGASFSSSVAGDFEDAGLKSMVFS